MSRTASASIVHQYSLGDEIASSITHGIGALLSIIGLVVLVAFAATYGQARAIASCAVFGSTLVLLYTASTVYHTTSSVQYPSPSPRIEPWLRRLDHIAIYFLIAGTYTPFTLIALSGAWGWSLFGLVWTLAFIGSAMELGFLHEARLLASLLYIAMGWVGLIAIGPLVKHVPIGGLVLLFSGGLAYTLGVPFYLSRRIPYSHTIWHLFVMAGSVLHYLAVLLYVLPNVPHA
ncbi:hemolysin III family protein [Oleiagrimonas sp.]|jgi:hemolysin III|uniref:PAQR family membrane homeostasis protein TrhA n=1 Tax=Oleiagrimonas sp. TaxID=2010330 RepID=UPI0026367E65|nr:hemolysin III family protein [Oleiagrimonas sp.]MDA3912747.1 hemolysin III family protein [Oleiagrimonas sp.]